LNRAVLVRRMLLSPAQLISKLFYQNTETTAEKKQQSKCVHAGTDILHKLSDLSHSTDLQNLIQHTTPGTYTEHQTSLQ